MNNLGVLGEKTYRFALRVVNAYKFLCKQNEYVLSKQLLQSGTSIGANYREAINAQSKLDFINKLNIALKEADETAYWLELLKDGEYITEDSFTSIHNDCVEIIKLLTAIIKKTKRNLDS